ncbi:uncharacterized [Tachysurus ichikawai]
MFLFYTVKKISAQNVKVLSDQNGFPRQHFYNRSGYDFVSFISPFCGLRTSRTLKEVCGVFVYTGHKAVQQVAYQEHVQDPESRDPKLSHSRST